ncbi:uroporphyrinogen-III synthase [Persephonella sp.]
MKKVTVLITKPEDQAKKVKDILSEDKFSVVFFPTIKTVPVDFDTNVECYEMFIFTSVNAVKYFFRKISPEKLKNRQIIAVGEKTKKSLERLGFQKIRTPEIQSSKGILQMLQKEKLKNRKIVLPRAKKGIDLLEKEVENLRILPVYETILNIPENINEVRNMFEKGEIDYSVFTSPSNFKNLLKIFPEKGISYLKKTKIIPIGDTTATTIKEKGLNPYKTPEKPSIEEIANLIKKLAYNTAS